MPINIPFHLTLAKVTYHLMVQQELQGVNFDVNKARELVNFIDNKMEEIRAEVENNFPPRPLKKGEISDWTPPKRQFLKTGEPSSYTLKWFDDVYLEGEDYIGKKITPQGTVLKYLPCHESVIKSLPMQMKDQAEIKDWLLSLGWKPTMYNVKKKDGKPVRDEHGKLINTSPKLHDKGRLCPNLEALGDKVETVRPLVKWLSLRSRRSVLLSTTNEEKGWLNVERLNVDGKLSAGSFGLTTTLRQRHKEVRNVPKADPDVLLGKEFRGLFIASAGTVLVGADAKALEDCIKGHYVFPFDGGEYARKILDPNFDAHQENAELWGCTRTQAKSPGYALQYNCQPKKFSDTLGVSLAEGTQHWNNYWDKNWALRAAIEATEDEWKRNNKKYITSIDGSKIVCRSKHSVFNFKCQSTGAIVMNLAGWYIDKWVKHFNIQAHRVIYMHDEYQYEVRPDQAELLGELMVKAITKAGEYFKLNVPLTGDYAVGTDWSMTH